MIIYAIKLKEFFEDDRLQQGAKLLFKVYRMKIIEGAVEVV